jgi:hypothetical protein
VPRKTKKTSSKNFLFIVTPSKKTSLPSHNEIPVGQRLAGISFIQKTFITSHRNPPRTTTNADDSGLLDSIYIKRARSMWR